MNVNADQRVQFIDSVVVDFERMVHNWENAMREHSELLRQIEEMDRRLALLRQLLSIEGIEVDRETVVVQPPC